MQTLYPQKCLNRHYSALSTSFDRGNTIAEYLMIGILVVIVTIAALQVLGGNLNKAFAMIRQDMKTHNQSAVTALLKKQAQANGYSSTLTTSQLAQLQLPFSTRLQTTGANGATELLASQIGQTAALLMSEGKIDQAQYDILMQLANQGHKMAQIESMIAQALKFSNGDITAFNNTQFTVDGQTYLAGDLGGLIGSSLYTPSSYATMDILTIPSTDVTSQVPGSQQEMTILLDLYKQALSSGALSDPIAKATVESATTQIASIGEITEDNTGAFKAGTATDAQTLLTTQAASQATNMNSSHICTAGNFQDNGVLCTP